MTHARDPKQRIHHPTPHPPSPPQKSFRFVCARVLAYGLQWKFISQGGCAISRFPLGGRRTFSFPSHSPNCLSNFSWAYQKHLRIRFREYDLMTLECRNEADNTMSNFSLLCCMVSLNKFRIPSQPLTSSPNPILDPSYSSVLIQDVRMRFASRHVMKVDCVECVPFHFET